LFIATAFLCAAAFILVFEKYGPVEACFTGAAIFFVVTLIAAAATWCASARSSCAPRLPPIRDATVLADPMVVAAGLQLVRTIASRTDPVARGRGIGAGLDGQPQPCRDQAPAE